MKALIVLALIIAICSLITTWQILGMRARLDRIVKALEHGEARDLR